MFYNVFNNCKYYKYKIQNYINSKHEWRFCMGSLEPMHVPCLCMYDVHIFCFVILHVFSAGKIASREICTTYMQYAHIHTHTYKYTTLIHTHTCNNTCTYMQSKPSTLASASRISAIWQVLSFPKLWVF